MNSTLKRIFLFRHGETDWNANHLIQGQADIPLNEVGRSQAKILSKAFEYHRPELIISSDLQRAHETAKIAAAPHGIPILLDPLLREAFVGAVQGLTYQQFVEKYGDETLRQWRSGEEKYRHVSFSGGESGHDIIARANQILEKCLKHPAQSIALSTHGGVIRRIAQAHLGFNQPDSQFMAINGVLHEIEVNEKLQFKLKNAFHF